MNMNSGYSGYSMSNRAVEAYYNGEKPMSRWTKAAIIDAIKEIDEEKAEYFRKVSLFYLKAAVLRVSSWHHTSSMCNRTNFYTVDEWLVNNASIEDIKKLAAKGKEPKLDPTVKYRGTIQYIEWTGTRKHPIANNCEYKDVMIEEKGCFYIVTDPDTGEELLRKKVGSNGTYVFRN